MHIRFFYSNERNLLSAKNKFLVKDSPYRNIDDVRNILHLNFCMGFPLHDLAGDSLEYVKMGCLRFKRKKSFSSVDYYNLLDSFLYLIATGYQFKASDKWLVSFSKCFSEKVFLDGEDDFENRSKVYLLLIQSYALQQEIDLPKFIYENENRLGDYYKEFVGLINKDSSELYTLLSTELRSCNRMKQYYERNKDIEVCVGYQDFSSILSVLGILILWKAMGLKLDNIIVNEIFNKEFDKDISFFDF